MKKIKLAVVVTIAVFTLVSGAAYGKDKYIVGIPIVAGMEETSLAPLFKELVSVVSGKLGIEAETRFIIYTQGDNILKLVLAEVDAGRVDITLLFGMEYSDYLATGRKDLIPMVTLSIAGQTLLPNCLFVRKGEFKSIEDLKGKRWAASSYRPSRDLLYKKGIDMPLEKFFGSISYVNDSPITTIINGLEKGDFDVFGSYDAFVRVAGFMTKKDVFFEPLVCEDYDHSWIFVAKKDIDAELIKKFRSLLLNAHKDQDFAKFQFAFQMIQGKFLAIKDDQLNLVIKNYELSEKRGWRKEEDAFMKKYRPKK